MQPHISISESEWTVGRMDISILYIGEDAVSVFESVKACFSQAFPNRQIEWANRNREIRTSLSVTEEEITGVFQDLVGRYPNLSVMAVCSREIREDDRSAQWWDVTKIYSKREDNGTKIVRDSSTYWN